MLRHRVESWHSSRTRIGTNRQTSGRTPHVGQEAPHENPFEFSHPTFDRTACRQTPCRPTRRISFSGRWRIGSESRPPLLLKALYGLPQAPKLWFETIPKDFKRFGWDECPLWPGVFNEAVKGWMGANTWHKVKKQYIDYWDNQIKPLRSKQDARVLHSGSINQGTPQLWDHQFHSSKYPCVWESLRRFCDCSSCLRVVRSKRSDFSPASACGFAQARAVIVVGEVNEGDKGYLDGAHPRDVDGHGKLVSDGYQYCGLSKGIKFAGECGV